MHLHKSYMDEDCAFDYVAKVIIFMPWFWCSSNSIMGVLTFLQQHSKRWYGNRNDAQLNSRLNWGMYAMQESNWKELFITD